jgi:hypothetical protein
MKRLTRHARDRIDERGLSLEEIEVACSRSFAGPNPGSGIGTLEVVGPHARSGRRLKVVLSATDPDLVITAYLVD